MYLILVKGLKLKSIPGEVRVTVHKICDTLIIFALNMLNFYLLLITFDKSTNFKS